MDLQQAKHRIAEIDRSQDGASPHEIEAFCDSLIASLPRNAETSSELIWAYNTLISQRIAEGRMARAARVFKQYLADCAPACDAEYDRIYQDGLQATGTWMTPLRRRERFFSLVQLFRQTLPLQGIVAECGCFRGLSSYLLCSTLKAADSSFDGSGYRIFDSFAGLSAPQPEDLVEGNDREAKQLRYMTRPGKFAAALDTVKASLAAFPKVEFFPGWIPNAFPDEPDARYRFVHVDVDIYQPTRDSIDYFYPKLVPGGILVCDDYNWPGARKAIDEMCKKFGATFATTPNTQAYMIKKNNQ